MIYKLRFVTIRILVVFLMFSIFIPSFTSEVYAKDIDIPAGIPGAGHNVYDGHCPDEINGVGITMKKIAIVPRSHPQGIAYGDGYFYIAYHQGAGGDGSSGTVDRIPEVNVTGANGGVAAADKSFSASIGHGQGIECHNGLLYVAPGDGHALKAYDSEGNLKKTESTTVTSHYHLAIDKNNIVWNVSSGGSENGDHTKARYAKLGSDSWDSIGMNHGANLTQASQGGGYNPATDRVAFMSNGIIMTFPAKKDMKGSDVHMFPFNCNPESEGITFKEDGTGYAILRGDGTYFIMEVHIDDDKVEDDRKELDFSFYELASRASVAFQQAMMGDEVVDMVSSQSQTGNSCTYLGYTKGSDMTFHSLATRNSQNTVSYSYRAIEKIGTLTGGDDDEGFGFTSYSKYGRILNDLGYDEVGSQTTKATRLLAGSVLVIAYYIGIAVPLLFGFVLDFLKAFNPFALLGVVSNNLADYGGSLEVLSQKFNTAYDWLYNMSLFVMIPIIAALGFGMAMLSGRQAGRKAVSVFVMMMFRIFMVIFSIPIIGAGYTHFLDEIGEMHVFGPESANQIIYSELVDFQGWAHNTNINPPSGLELKWKDNDAVMPKEGIRMGARKINVLAGHDAAKTSTGAGKRFTDGYKQGESTGMEVTLTKYNYDDDKTLSDQISETHNLMMRYMKADVYSASAYETEVKQVVSERISNGDRSVKEMILRGSAGGHAYAASVGTCFGNGTMKYSGGAFTPGVVDGDMFTGNRGLSTLGMYNYLNSKFDDSDMTIYGSKVSSNERVKDSHMSVTSVGTGIYGGLLYLQTVVSLFCLGIIGLIYGIGIIGVSFKRGFATIASMPGMMLGSKAAIGKLLSSALMLFIELLTILVFYAFFTELILVINDAFVAIFR